MGRLLLILVLFTVSCGDKIEVSGHREDIVREMTSFHSVSVGDGLRVVVRRGEQSGLSVKTFTSVQGHIKTFVANEVLHVEMDRSVEFDNDPNVIINIVTGDMREMMLSSGVSVFSDDQSFVNSAEFVLNISDGSTFEGNIVTDKMSVRLSGGARVKFTGAVRSLVLDGSGGAIADCPTFSTETLTALLSGGSVCDITVNDRVDKVTLSGGSTLTFRGTRIVNDIDISGGSSLINKN